MVECLQIYNDSIARILVCNNAKEDCLSIYVKNNFRIVECPLDGKTTENENSDSRYINIALPPNLA